MSSTEKAFNAAILIQKWFRRYLAVLEIRRRCSWQIFQSLEYAGEQDQTKLYNFFNDLITHIFDANPYIAATVTSPATPSLKGSHPLMSQPDKEDMALWEKTNPDTVTLDNCYKGPKLKLPLTAEDVFNLTEHFKERKRLHAKYVLTIIHGARKILKYKPNINFASTVHARQITVCGDLHGKVEDLFTIFYKNGLPSRANPYVFNGDFVDRGTHSIEVLMLLLASFVAWPDAVFLNRGNHEDFSMNIRYGFLKEVMVKYNRHAAKILQAVEDLYAWLPLATVIDNKVFVVHGGISDTTNLKDIAALDRHKFITVLRPPVKRGHLEYEPLQWKQIVDLLWSDPRPLPGCSYNFCRGGGCFFGPEVTHEFLKKHQFDKVIRSHQCKPDGYEFAHDDEVITVFSASNYYDIGSNKGAYLKLIGPKLLPRPVMYVSNKNARHATLRQRQGGMEKSAVLELKRHISSKRFLLLSEFQKRNKEMLATIPISDWCDAMDAAIGLGLPWRLICSKLARYDEKTGMVEYMSTMEDYHTYTEGLIEDGHTLLEALYKNKETLETVFKMIDKDGNGSISMEEFSDACAFLGEQLGKQIPPGTIQDLAHSIDINKDGFIDLNEFLEAFRLVHGNRPEESVKKLLTDPDSPCSDSERRTRKISYGNPGTELEDEIDLDECSSRKWK